MKIRDIDPEPSPMNEEHAALGIPPVEATIAHPGPHPVIHAAMWFAGLVLFMLSSFLIGRMFVPGNGIGGTQTILNVLSGDIFWTAALVGFIAQVIDGALGMAYGITATTFLLATGSSPAMASASVHIAEIFTTGLSGVAHAKLGNVDRSLFLRMLIPGMLGAILGAVLITQLDGDAIKPYVSAYLAFMGIYVLRKAFRHKPPAPKRPRHVGKLALLGGFVDSAGGGGWGPVVTSSLLGSGHDPRTTIGSVNFAEFFLTLTSGAAFTLLVGTGPWPVVAGLVFGGLFAAPLAAVLCRKLKARTLLILVGGLVSGLSLFNLWRALAI